MAPFRHLMACVGLGILSLPGAASAQGQRAAPDESTKEMAQKIQSLLDQVNELRRRLDEQIRVSQQSKSEADAAAAVPAKAQGAALPAQMQSQVQSQTDAAKGIVDTLHYKGVTVTLGGFLAAESIYRQHDQANDISTNFAAIPYANNSVGQTQELRFTARQSRVSALVQGSPSPQTHLGFYSEFDFQGAAQTANSNESNSYTPRLRHMHGTVD
jgi:pyruvate dehydrogenase complex dehydrogenase (E1) component